MNRPCRDEFEKNIRKIETDAQRAALFCVENHHKYLLGHMIVFRMHLNKSQDYVQRCQKINRSCGTPCEAETAEAVLEDQDDQITNDNESQEHTHTHCLYSVFAGADHRFLTSSGRGPLPRSRGRSVVVSGRVITYLATAMRQV
ncbi:jg747 [Pararge aegeria aegeria]|uniref:Jg747 protein n=1 Tax=Pararge aegeria aegeria TaxID=348720 RepID=A0A8S4S2V9_9NEOP|nr:jg747 [Pararge aegeria aegeria]